MNNGVVIALLIILLFLIYQVFDLKKEMRSYANNRVDVDFPSSLYLNGLAGVSSSFGDGGFWVYKHDEQQVYFFKYDAEIEQIVMTKKIINR